jgi:hypothetical protein
MERIGKKLQARVKPKAVVSLSEAI